MKTTIFESGMSFITPDKECLFYIEQSGLYKKVQGSGVCTTEYIYLKSNKQLQFVEAKKTCPNANNREESKEKKEKYEEYYQTITRKFTDSMSVLSALLLEKQIDNTAGHRVTELKSLRDIKLYFILVIKEAEEAWLGGVKAELDYRLKPLRGIWGFEIQVLNEELAALKGIVEEK